MKILLRILVFFLFVLSGVSLFLGIQLFNKREMLKARVNELERAVSDLSKQIEAEKGADREQRQLATVSLDPQKLKFYYAMGPDGKPRKEMDPKRQKMVRVTKGPGTMKQALENLQEKAIQQSEVLDKTRQSLKETRLSLEENRDKLSKKIAEVGTAQENIQVLDEKLAELNEETVQLKNTIDTKEEQITLLNTQMEDQKAKMGKLEDKIFEQQNRLTAQDKYITELRQEIERLKSVKEGVFKAITQGIVGSVLSVNPEFNIVVLKTLPDSNLSADVTLLVRREKKLVGKIRTIRVKEEQNMAVAEILWLQMPIQKGDSADYVGR